jgi:hypothetical protein
MKTWIKISVLVKPLLVRVNLKLLMNIQGPYEPSTATPNSSSVMFKLLYPKIIKVKILQYSSKRNEQMGR